MPSVHLWQYERARSGLYTPSAVQGLRYCSTHVPQNHANPGTLGRLVWSTFVGRYLMSTDYHAIAGQSLERLAALSDGVFAIAMTLLVLDLRVPVSTGIQFERDLWRALMPLAPHLVLYGLSFMTLGIFWSRILSYQALYAVSILLCLVNPALSIAGLILLQISSILARRLRLFSRR
jgi:hypothetical protein